ncbi:tyrosine-type recombinase/integrase [Deinococcus frigens]|uniref:tyrosine-type recombinase/integrase n=1 Tax=Deinococcus frigens TaxID=249403 RepID=UPI000A02176B
MPGRQNCTPHKLRHSHATALVKAGRRLEEVQEILGHESIATTRIYAHLEPERLAAAAACRIFSRDITYFFRRCFCKIHRQQRCFL